MKRACAALVYLAMRDRCFAKLGFFPVAPFLENWRMILETLGLCAVLLEEPLQRIQELRPVGQLLRLDGCGEDAGRVLIECEALPRGERLGLAMDFGVEPDVQLCFFGFHPKIMAFSGAFVLYVAKKELIVL